MRHLRITHTEDLPRLMGSKYVQSRMGDYFTRVRLDLEQGRKVLFSGTGCQVQGLLGYLGGPKPGLLTVDVICHGVPSEAVWQAYAKVIGAQLPLSFRDKCTGWQQYSVQLNGTAHPYRQDPYMRLFLSDVILRPSCYHCPAKGASRVSDLTLADFWGIQNVDRTMFDDKGHLTGAGAQRRRGTSLGADPIGSTTESRIAGVCFCRKSKCTAFCYGTESTGCVLCGI